VRLSDKGSALIESFEGFRSCPYRDPVGVWTIGFGSTKGVGPGTPCVSRSQARARLKREVDEVYGAAVNNLGVPLNQNQFDALCSFVYNVGTGGIGDTKVGRALQTRSYRAAADHLLEWNRAGGRILEGLTRRRKAERELFLSEPKGFLTKDEEYHVSRSKQRGIPLERAERIFQWLSGRANRIKYRARAKGLGGWSAQNRGQRFQALQKARVAHKKRIDAARKR
jgi:lysozyme